MPGFFNRARLKSKVGGRLRDAGEDLYDIRGGRVVIGGFLGAGRRFREVSDWPGLAQPA